MNTEELKAILDSGKRANLSGADLSEADLHEADLREAILRWTSLCEADLHEADLHGADLREADLRKAVLRDAILSGTDLYRVKGILSLGPGGSRGGMLYAVDHGDHVMVKTGCFWGSLDEFAAAVEATHKIDKHGDYYRAAIVFIRAWHAGQEAWE